MKELKEIKKVQLSSYTETMSSECWIADPTSIEDFRNAIAWARDNHLKICPRASGYSYGDSILNQGNLVINTNKINKIISWDKINGRIKVQPGTFLIDVFNQTLSDGWSLTACPGGADISISGAVSNNVHGKDPHKTGNFGEQVLSLDVMDGNGQITKYTRENHSAVLNGLCGGMGLLGLITEVELQLKKIESPFVRSSIHAFSSIEKMIDELKSLTLTQDFIVGWVDWLSKGESTGRGLLSYGKWAEEGSKLTKASKGSSIIDKIPAEKLWMLFNPFGTNVGTSAFNLLNYSIHSLLDSFNLGQKEEYFTDYNFWTAKMPHTKDFCKGYGYMENQIMIPTDNATQFYKELIQKSQQRGFYPIMSILKAHRKDDFLISFAGDMISMTIEWNLKGKSIKEVAEFGEFILKETANEGGKAYLAKDQLMTKEFFRLMYPNWENFIELKEKMDHENLFMSDMYRRLLSNG